MENSQTNSDPNTERPGPLRIGSVLVDPPVLMAPMAGFTNWAYRELVRRFGGCGLPATEMVCARGLVEMDHYGRGEPERLWGIRDEPRPLAVQIWDNDPDTLAEVARRVAHDYQASVVDLNFGCPARDISEKAESGSYLLDDPDRIGRIVARVVEACGRVPVTAKIRLGRSDDRLTAVDVAQAVEGAGGAAVTVHGRTARQQFSGVADWERIARIKSRLKRIPVVGNGDLETPKAVVDAFSRFGVDGVMIGRAALTRPWLFSRIEAALAGRVIGSEPSLKQQRDVLLGQLDLMVKRFGPRRGVVLMRVFACRLGAGRPGVRQFRVAICRATTVDEFVEIVRRRFPSER
ncbi:MAG: tRNA-dihydrouridine synthase [Pirellulales bacterium]|nr:tRNA-dihydrouridine synthase [Pirellulales bacterium]